jgi:hypothetical protein
MMIDVSKIRVGDEVTVRAKVVEVSTASEIAAGSRPVRIMFPWLDRDEIVSHHPAPREFKPGDKAIAYDAVSDSKDICNVLAVDGAFAWVRNHRTGGRWTASVSDLRHADESE